MLWRTPAALQKELLLTDCRKSFARLIAEKHSREASKLAAQAKDSSSHPDELIDFSHLKAREGLSQLEIEDSIATDLKRAMGDTTAEDAGDGVRLEYCPQQNQLPTVSLHKQISYLSGLCSAKDLTNRGRYTLLLCSAETVLRMMSQLPAAAAMLSGSEDTTNLKQ